VLRTQWAAASLVPLATILRDINLPTPPRRKLVGKMSARLAEVEPTQMPALVYQLLLLADTEGKPGVLRALNAHFERVEGEAWLLVQGTVLLHVQFAVKQDQALGHAVLRQVKAGQLPLGRVSFALLLSLVRTVRPRARRAAPRRHLRRGVGESLLLARERHVSAAAPVARGTARAHGTHERHYLV